MKRVGIIPARFASSRLPGKLLAKIAGKPMVQHVWERARRVRGLAAVIVATDSAAVCEAVAAFGGVARLTSAGHRTGTDRLAEVARDLDADLVVNIQGDEPLLDPEEVENLIAPFDTRPDLMMATLATPIQVPGDIHDPSVVKVVVDQAGYALYFSRLPIPYYRDGQPGEYLKHIGLYAYRREFLLRFASLPPTPLEQAEQLEQLRALEHGYRIAVVRTEQDSIGVDTPADLDRVRRMLEVGKLAG
ncbi:MAG: 3-deoxy-manno-octulosonate cytidylyltransferase [Armatimonadetes bacterium]|nr:3-deoxy-manno-octulosonate cytidylyltransferase [Armatimonadota bacterium]